MTPPARAHAVLAHYFHGGVHRPTQGSLSATDFAGGLDAYGSRLIPADDWIARAVTGRLRDEVCVTIDDGLRGAYDIALPELHRRGLTAAWNIYTQPYVGVPHTLERWRWLRNHAFGSVEAFYAIWRLQVHPPVAPADYLAAYGYLTDEDRAFRYWRNECVSPAAYEQAMTALADQSTTAFPADHWLSPEQLRALWLTGHVIGLHSHTHPTMLARASTEQQAVEYATCRWVLARLLDVPPETLDTVSYPCGGSTPGGRAWLEAHGIRLAWHATMDGAVPWQTPRWSTGYWR